MTGSVDAYHRALHKYVMAAGIVSLFIFAISVWRAVYQGGLEVLVLGATLSFALIVASFVGVSVYYLLVALLTIADRPRV